MAVASAIAAISAGADGLKCAMAGKDILEAGKIADALATCSAQIGIETSLKNTKIHASIDDLLASISHEDYDTKEVSEKKKILLDSDSTISQVAQAAGLLGYDLSDADCGNVHKALLQVCETKDAVGAKELEALIASSAMQAPSTYHFETYTTTSSNVASSMSQVTLKCGEEIICGVASGEGPIDSAFRAIEQCVGHHYELDDFQVQSVTEGKEALGSALVRLRNNGKLYSGNGTSTDIVAASIRAYINALNKIVFEEA
jgi:2-isopropylmalate synthase